MNIQVSKDGKIVTVDDIIYIRKDEVSALKTEKDKAPLTERISACETIERKFLICCNEVGVDPNEERFHKGDYDTQCYERLKVVTRALNGGKTMKVGERRYNPYFYKDKNSRFSYCGSFYFGSSATVSPLLQNPTSELAVFSGNEFLEYWKMWHGQD